VGENEEARKWYYSYKYRYGMVGGNDVPPEPKLHYTRRAKARRVLGKVHVEVYNPKHRVRVRRAANITGRGAKKAGMITYRILRIGVKSGKKARRHLS